MDFRIKTLSLADTTIYYLDNTTSFEFNELEAHLHPEERTYLGRVGAKSRKEEFAKSRFIIHQVMGSSEIAVLNSEQRNPLWPPGYLGSISHKHGHIFVTTMQSDSVPFESVGIDIESVSKKIDQVFAGKVCTPFEIQWVNSQYESNSAEFSRVVLTIFSLKESLFKALFPLGKEMFYFQEAQTHPFLLKEGQATLELLKNVAPGYDANRKLSGYFYDGILNSDFLLSLVKA